MLKLRQVVILSGLSIAGLAGAEDRLQYNQDIRPILADNCFQCHGPDSASRKADLRLDQRETAVEMAAIAPGDPDQSELIRRINATDPEEVMPPAVTKKTLTAKQKEKLAQWIQEGAEYQPHWSLIPPQRPIVPAVKNAAWVRNPIDNFVLAKLESLNLAPAPEADRHTLARRVSLDLTGLPPEPGVVEAFVADQSPDAYESLVEKLLESSAWGEHRGRYWLDYCRYADTHGIHFDNFREMWTYRDWAINAFNHNMPYNQFTIVSLAGDLLPNASLEERIGSGFNRCNMTTNEGGAIDEEYRVLYARERTEATSQVWLGLTAGCAVCHSHKFDPLSQKEFYSLSAFFNNTTQPIMDGNIPNTPPVVVVPQEEDRARWEELEPLVNAAKERVERRREAARPRFDEWLKDASPELFRKEIPTRELLLHVPLNREGPTASVAVRGDIRELPFSEETHWQSGKSGDRAATIGKDALLEFPDLGDYEVDEPFSVAAWIKIPEDPEVATILGRMDDPDEVPHGWELFAQYGTIGLHLIDTLDKNALKVRTEKKLRNYVWAHVVATYDGSRQASGIQIYLNGESWKTTAPVANLTGSIRTNAPLKIGKRNTHSLFRSLAINDLRIYNRVLSSAEAAALARATRLAAIVATPADKRKKNDVDDLFSDWLPIHDAEHQQVADDLAVLENEGNAIKTRGTIAHVMQESDEQAMAYILNRGEYDKRGEEVPPDTPAALPKFPDDFPRTRLGLAQWLLLRDQPLTGRVTVNRFWQEVFGTGLVKTTGDFGVKGELPSHPELLDWLAVEFMDSGWDVKELFRQIVMSSTYRQSSQSTPEKLERDPENRLLAHGPRFRMDAEMVRDGALAASGLLVRKIGGPSVKPYQPEGVWEAVAMLGSNTRHYEQGTGEDLYRRSLYTFIKRAAPPPSLETFNAPSREVCTVQRERTNTPLQALLTLNDVQYVEAARYFAQRAIQSGPAFEDRLNFISWRLISRGFCADEIGIIRQSLARLREYYLAQPEDAGRLIHVGESQPEATIPATELAAWTMLINELMNLDEALNK